MKNNDELAKLYDEWWHNRTPEQCELQGLCFDCEEEYFEDMLLKDGPLLNGIIKTVLDYTDSIFLGIDGKLRLYIIDTDDFNGCFCSLPQKIEINRPYIHDKSVILHELIHYFECRLEEELKEVESMEFYSSLKALI